VDKRLLVAGRYNKQESSGVIIVKATDVSWQCCSIVSIASTAETSNAEFALECVTAAVISMQDFFP
jgi:hypothetical protein